MTELSAQAHNVLTIISVQTCSKSTGTRNYYFSAVEFHNNKNPPDSNPYLHTAEKSPSKQIKKARNKIPSKEKKKTPHPTPNHSLANSPNKTPLTHQSISLCRVPCFSFFYSEVNTFSS